MDVTYTSAAMLITVPSFAERTGKGKLSEGIVDAATFPTI